MCIVENLREWEEENQENENEWCYDVDRIVNGQAGQARGSA
jgi:hypothetical protein